ncbi:hypothetical protein [Fulvitalea axinellae]
MPNIFADGEDMTDGAEPVEDDLEEMLRNSKRLGIMGKAFERMQAEWMGKRRRAETNAQQSDRGKLERQAVEVMGEISDLREEEITQEADHSLRISSLESLSHSISSQLEEPDIFQAAMIAKVNELKTDYFRNKDLMWAYEAEMEKLGDVGSLEDVPVVEKTEDWEMMLFPETEDLAFMAPDVSAREIRAILSRNPGLAVHLIEQEIDRLAGLVEKGSALVKAKDDQNLKVKVAVEKDGDVVPLPNFVNSLDMSIVEIERLIDDLLEEFPQIHADAERLFEMGTKVVETIDGEGGMDEAMKFASAWLRDENYRPEEEELDYQDALYRYVCVKFEGLESAKNDRDYYKDMLRTKMDTVERYAVTRLTEQMAKLKVAKRGFVPQRVVMLGEQDQTGGQYARVETWQHLYRYEEKLRMLDEMEAESETWRTRVAPGGFELPEQERVLLRALERLKSEIETERANLMKRRDALLNPEPAKRIKFMNVPKKRK